MVSTFGKTCFVLQPIQSTPPDDIWQVNDQLRSASDRRSTRQRGQFAESARWSWPAKKATRSSREQLKDHLYREASLKLMKCESA